GRTVSRVSILFPKAVRNDPQEFIDHMTGQTLGSPTRRGKMTLLPVGPDFILIVHLKMTGQLLWIPQDATVAKHTHVIIEFTGSPNQLRFRDQRRFGYLALVNRSELAAFPPYANLAPDFKEINQAEFLARLASKKGRLKPLLLDQRVVSGLGNIYADESL
ncbi:MAG: DNA-formamidopyrimidine glycosylase, partial [Deltaproteobacteria bacterium]|nr:DNA-formamidopyrimidine glycosylase [Deltaproteobacteria bacterium]